jgi:hypothetical protein
MTEEREIRVKALGLAIEFFNMFKQYKMFTEPPGNQNKDTVAKGGDIIEAIFKTSEQFEEFILKIP